MKNMLKSLLVAGALPAVVWADDTPAAATPEADWFGIPAPADGNATAEQSLTAEQAAIVLADRLSYVYDRETADAAASHIAPLVPMLIGQGGEETFWVRMHMAYTGCYGSPALQEVLAPLLPPPDLASNPAYEKSLPILLDVLQTLDDIAATLHGVTDRATADAAAENIMLFAGHLDDCQLIGNSVAAPQGNRMDMVVFFYSSEYRRSAAIYREWGELQNRSLNYYGSELLAEAMENLSAAMENLDQFADPYAVGRMVLICPQLEDRLRLWLSIASGVHDLESANAAAPLLQACVEDMRAIAAPLGRGYEKDLDHVSPMFLFLTLACDRISSRFARAGYYGSDALRAVLEHK